MKTYKTEHGEVELKIPLGWKVLYNKIPKEEIDLLNLEYVEKLEKDLFKAVSDTGYRLHISLKLKKREKPYYYYYLRLTRGEGFDEVFAEGGTNDLWCLITQINITMEELIKENHLEIWEKGLSSYTKPAPKYLLVGDRYFSREGEYLVGTDKKTKKEIFRKNIKNAEIRWIYPDPFGRGIFVLLDSGGRTGRGINTLGLFDFEGELIFWVDNDHTYDPPKKIEGGIAYLRGDQSFDCEIDLKTGKLLKSTFSKI